MSYLEPRAGKRLEDYPLTTIANLTTAAGTADNALVDVGAAYNQAALNDNFADLAGKLNAVLAALRAAGIIG